MYHVSAQGIDERVINVHYYYYYYMYENTTSRQGSRTSDRLLNLCGYCLRRTQAVNAYLIIKQ